MASRWRLLPDDPDIGWIPYAFVSYIAFVFLAPILGELDDPTIWWASAISIVPFLPLYFVAYWVTRGRRLVVAVGIALIGTALAPFNPGASTYFLFAAYFAGLSHEDPRRSIPAAGLILVLTLATGAALAPTVYFLAPGVLGVVVLGLLGSFFGRRNEQIGELRMARAEVEALARIAERDRIAGDLHDLLGHTLSVIVLKSELTRALISRDQERAAREAAEIQEIARKALSEVRIAVRGYRVGNGAGLRQELDGVERALQTAGVELSIEAGPEVMAGRLDAAHEGVLALAVREAATNIMRHARARHCWVAFFDESGEYGVEIRDDGRGLAGRMGHGLVGMRQRVEALAGRMTVEGARSGTRLRIVFEDVERVRSEDAA
ncbi:sensor histidine kinase [Paraliomyxa miuraensis]|uniref:sensor histidine kinase n=1 Tax=Paraliomyxa miuraensis TaxID=376150 RepID=UPI0022555722|nr:sensor histidine kinase [Paraliomyxa miuraensis]MCX4239274.1 sensor histidine kinase [Paraliomyxa miuraensis]